MKDKYEQLKEQLLKLREYLEKVSDINPDQQIYLQGRDLYICHAEQVVDEVLALMEDIDGDKSPTYTTKWVKSELKQAKEDCE